MKKILLLSLLSISGIIMAHTTLEELNNKLKKAQEQVTVGAVYRHYRDTKLQYKVLSVGLQEATEKVCVVYQSLYDPKITWVRDLDSWLDTVTFEGKMVSRFQQIQK